MKFQLNSRNVSKLISLMNKYNCISFIHIKMHYIRKFIKRCRNERFSNLAIIPVENTSVRF